MKYGMDKVSSSTTYDEKLLDIDFFQIHKEYLPYIGKDYEFQKHKILLIGESHYVDDNWSWGYDALCKWTDENWQEELLADNAKIEWFNTRIHAARASKYADEPEKAISQVIKNPSKELAKYGLLEETDPDLYVSKIAFMNFFRFPSLINGKGIWNSFVQRTKSIKGRELKGEIRKKIWDNLFIHSKEIVDETINIINPNLVIICSTLAGKAYFECQKDKPIIAQNGAYVDYTSHSTSLPWKSYQKHFEKTGEQRCDEIIQKYMGAKRY